MKIFHDKASFSREMSALKAAGKRIGLVPTMGFLHAGHLSLVKEAKKHCDAVALSIFVNPIQFGPNEDFDKYPRDFGRDCRLCEEAGVDYIFAPAAADMYDEDASVRIHEDKLSSGLCGAMRPGHFDGVCTVVAKLFNLSRADVAVFGQKDAQQALVIKRMVRDLDFPIEIITAPLVRDEKDNLALSSRNRYLSDEERERALVLNRSLFAAVQAISRGGLAVVPGVTAAAEFEIRQKCTSLDYLKCLDADTLSEPAENSRRLIILAAAYFGKTRLIDNMTVDIK